MLNKINTAILKAVADGFTISENGKDVHTGLGKKRSLAISGRYLSFGVTIDKYKSISVHVHRFQAYKKFGDIIFRTGVVVRHLNGNPLDNSWGNIGIGSQKDNIGDISRECLRAGAIKRGLGYCKIPPGGVKELIQYREETGDTHEKIAEKFGLSRGHVSNLLSGRSKRAIDE